MRFAERMTQLAAEVQSFGRELNIGRASASNVAEMLKGDPGFRVIGGRRQWTKESKNVAKLLLDVYEGRRDPFFLKEAMTTSDFTYLFGDVLYRQMLGNYTAWPATYPLWTRAVKVRDLRTLNMYTIDGGQGLLSAVGERDPYPETHFTDGRYQVSVAKYGRTFGITMEMVLNDDLNAFQSRPQAIAVAARRSESYLAVSQLFDANGPHASFFTTGNLNKVTGNPILSIAGLQTALKILHSQLDADGQPILINGATLLVPPALEVTGQNILNAIQIRVNADTAPSGGGTSNQYLYVENWMRGKLRLAVEPYIPYIATTNGNTSWAVIADPSDMGTRPAAFFAHLTGYEEPQLLMKATNAVTLGGGPANSMDGSFENDSIEYKLRHFFGAAQGDPKMAVASNGSGS